MKTIKALLLLMMLYPLLLSARKYTVSGYVMDASSSETMISATVYDEINQRGTATNPYAFYTILCLRARVVYVSLMWVILLALFH